MAFAVIMPKAGMSMETGRVVRWLKSVGDPVKTGEPLLEIETDKVTMEVEAEASGTLIEIISGAGAEVPVTTVIGWLGEAGEQAAAPTPPSPAPPHGPTTPPEMPRLAAETTNRVAATPLARTLARESGIDIGSVKPTGSRGQVMARDVRGAHRQPTAGERSREIALTLVVEADVSELEALRARVNEGLNARTSVTDWLIRAVALAIRDGFGSGLLSPDQVDVRASTDLEKGVPVPIIRSAGSLSVRAISERRRELADKARAGTLSPGESNGPAFPITSVESWDVIAVTPDIPPGESVALAAGCVRDSLALAGGAVMQRKVMYLSLAADRRMVDGDECARFLATLRAYLANPVALLVA